MELIASNDKIKSAIARVRSALLKRPAIGLGTGILKATIKDGLTCEIREGRWTMIADMPEKSGGNEAGPVPGVFGRAAFGSCLAIGYMMRAAALDIQIKSLEVEVQADFDDGVLFGTAPHVPAGYQEIRYFVNIESDASEEIITKMIDEADRQSPYLGVFSHAQACRREININKQP